MSDDHANWIGSDLVADLLAGPYDAEQDDGEVTLWFGEKPDAVSVTFNACGATFILSPHPRSRRCPRKRDEGREDRQPEAADREAGSPDILRRGP